MSARVPGVGRLVRAYHVILILILDALQALSLPQPHYCAVASCDMV